MKYIIRCPDGSRYKVREAKSLQAACAEIAHARATGSIGGKSSVTSVNNKSERQSRIIADIIQINSDGTERQPYTKTY